MSLGKRKKRIVFQSDFGLAKTGFGKNTKIVLSYLYGTGKYEIISYCCGLPYSHPDLTKTPWKSIGCLPNNANEFDQMINAQPPEKREPFSRFASYGGVMLDKIINEEKPDVYIAVQDFWGVDFAIDKPWFNKISSVIWTTLDSIPILPSAVECAPKIKNYWIWSNFAEKELHRLGHTHVRTVHGALNDKYFHKLSDKEKLENRSKNKIDPNTFIIGFVFRNQLRKSVPNLLDGYKKWKNARPDIKSKLLFHTHFTDGGGWDIPRFANEYSIDQKDILTTYICRNCKNYEVKPYIGQDINCDFCKAEKAQITTNVGCGINENQLNEVYNLMDVYVHPFTSGGQEIPIEEAKLCELITAVTNYSCGEELCEDGSGSIPLDWSEYREPGTQFKKASTSPIAIAEAIDKVYSMPKEEREVIGKQSREWVIKNFGIERVGKQIEDFIDSCPLIEDFSFLQATGPVKNPDADMNDVFEIEDDKVFIQECYKRILNSEGDDAGKAYWHSFLNQ